MKMKKNWSLVIGHWKLRRGFTLIETMLAIALIAVLSGLSIVFYTSFQNKNSLDLATNTITQSLRRAQVLSRAMDGDSTWGLNVQSGSITVFKGASYAARDITYDETFDTPTNITPSGLSEVVFTKLTGDPNSTGTFTLTNADGETSAITINGKGMISY